MRKNNCEVIRRQLDELMIGEVCSASAVAHLQECRACREFHQQQTKLREIVGSLGTVSAPADFDFRLRARLASDSSHTLHLRFVDWPFARKVFALATLLIAFAVGIVLIRDVLNRPIRSEVATDNVQRPIPAMITPVAPKPAENPQEFSAAAPASSPQKIKNERPAQMGKKIMRPMATVDFSSQRADLINGTELAGSSSTVFSIDASLQPFRVSLDDGRGNARIISVPTISFGSQRAPNANQFAPKGVW